MIAPLRELLTRSSNPGLDASDAQLLARIAEGEAAAFAEVWHRYGPVVLGMCHRILADHGAAEDAAQDAFARVWKGAASFDPARGVPAAWITRIARNSALNARRARNPEASATIEPVEESATDALADRFWLRALLRRLNNEEQIAIELAYFHDLSHVQIAERIGVPLGTVKARIRRGMIRLAELAEAETR